MKKFRSLFLSLVLVLAMCIGLVACNGGTPTSYTLTFDMNGQGEQVQAQVLGIDEIPSIPTKPEAEGYKFDGWFIDTEYSDYYYFDEPLEKNTTIYAKWTKLKKVSFVTNVSDIFVPNAYLEVGNLVNLPSQGSMVSAGKKFVGWFADEACTLAFNAQTTPITQDVTIYAKWTPYYKVTFDRNGRGSASSTPKVQEYFADGSKVVEPKDMEANGYKFLGWSTEENGKNNLWDFDAELTQSITLYAQWARLFTVTFDLNNEEALIAPPANQSVMEGECAVRPEVDPVVAGWAFEGWYVDAQFSKEFDFSGAITERTVVYAKWTKTGKEEIDSSDLPAYEWREEAAYGERPDLDGYMIDGFMGEDENWGDQVWYEHGFTEAPTVSYKMSTQFSDKGLYIFVQATDNGGLSFTGRGYHYKNTGMSLMVINGDIASPVAAFDSKTFRFDTYNARGAYHTYKIAIQVVEGSVNPTGDNKLGVWNAEIFFTWENLGFDQKPSNVKIVPWYYYKRIQSATSYLTMLPTFMTNTGIGNAVNFPAFNENGYMLGDKEDAVLGNSAYGIAKTNGWDLTNVDASENAYVETVYGNNNAQQALFFKQITGNYYEMETDIEVPVYGAASGNAGLLVYNSPILHAYMTVEASTTRCSVDGFLSVRPKFSMTNKDGNIVATYLEEIVFDQPIKKLNMKLIFSNGYVYYVLNGKMFYCQFLDTLAERGNPGIFADTKGIRFSNYKATVLTEEEAKEKASQYAYVVSMYRPQRITVEFDSIGVDRNDPAPITMTIVNDPVTLTASAKKDVLNNDFSDVRMYEIDTFSKSVNGGDYEDITDQFTSPVSGAKYGKYVLDNISGDTTYTNTYRLADTSNMVYIKANIINAQTGKPITGAPMATIKSSNPRMGNYKANIISGEMVAVVQKGWDYELSISVDGFRTLKLDKIENIAENIDLGIVEITPTIVGGVATSDDMKYSVNSTNSCFDYSEEDEGIVYYICEKPNSSVAYFSGKTMDKYQVAQVKIANITETDLVAVYEKDPACGFVIDNLDTNLSYFIGLHQKGLRFLQRGVAWNPTHFHTFGESTVNVATNDGSHYNTLTMVKVSNGGLMTLYMFIDGKFITSIDIAQMGGDTAIGFTVTTSYYTKIKFYDYWLKCGDEAIEEAKKLVGSTFNFDDSCYEYNDDYELDYSKPIVKISGFNKIEKDDGSIEEMAFAGAEVKISLNTENTFDGFSYSIKIGSDVLVLTNNSPTADYKIPLSMTGDINVSVNMSNSASIAGKIVYEDGTPVIGAEGELVAESGEVIPFRAGEDGTFIAYVIKGKVYNVKTNVPYYVNIGKDIKANEDSKDLGDITLIPAVIGGTSMGGLVSSTTATYGYDYSDNKGNVIEGLYTEVNAPGQNYQVYRGGSVTDFMLDFSFFRTEIPGVTNEHDPAVGLWFSSGSVSEFYGFWRNGSLVLKNGGWTDNRNTLGSMSASLQSYDVQFDFRIVRRANTFIFFAKTEDETEYRFLDSYTADKNFGRSEFRFVVTAGKPTHHFFYNVNLTRITGTNTPAFIEREINLVNDESLGSVRVLGSSHAEEGKYVVGDTLRINATPVKGKVLAYAVVNGKIVLPVDGVIIHTVDYKENNIEIYYEDEFVTRDVTGKIATIDGRAIPQKVKVVAYMFDGREYSFTVVPDAEGKFTINVRDGELNFYADADNFYSKPVAYTVSETATDIGTLTLDVYKIASSAITVNGGSMNTDVSYVYDRTLGEYRAPGRSGGTAYMPELITSGDFVFSCDVTLNTGDINSKYYTPDFSTGFEFTNGKANVDNQKTFGILFTCDGFRVSHGGWSSTYMVETHNGLDYYYPRNNPKDVTHNFKLVRLGTTLKVYVNDTLSMTIDPTNGVKMYVDGNVVSKPHTGAAGATLASCENWIKSQVNTMFGEDGGDIAIGYKVNVNTATQGVLNSAGFRNTTLVTDPEVIEQYR